MLIMLGLLILQDRTGKLVNGAIANLVDEVGGAVVHVEGLPMNVSVDMSISFLSTAHVGVSHKTHNNILSDRLLIGSQDVYSWLFLLE